MKELKEKQTQGLEIEMVKGNVDKTYELPAHESHLIHVSLETPSFDTFSGKKTSVPVTQKFSVDEFKRMESVSGFAQYKVIFLHDPSKGKALHGLERDHVAGDPSFPASIANQKTEYAASTMWKFGNKTELRAKYCEVYGVEEAPQELTKDELVADIEDRLENPVTEESTGAASTEASTEATGSATGE